MRAAITKQDTHGRWDGKRAIRATALALIVLWLSACGAGPTASTGEPTKVAGAAPTAAAPTVAAALPTSAGPVVGEHTVEYVLSGSTGSANAIYVGYDGESGESLSDLVTLPWNEKFIARDGEFLYVSGQNPEGGTLSCQIVLDGKVLNRSNGPSSGSVASCQAVIGE